MNDELARLLLRLQVLGVSWVRGAPVRPIQLDEQLQVVLTLANTDPASVLAVHRQLDKLVEALRDARVHNESELADLPRRRRAVRGHACLRRDVNRRFRIHA